MKKMIGDRQTKILQWFDNARRIYAAMFD